MIVTFGIRKRNERRKIKLLINFLQAVIIFCSFDVSCLNDVKNKEIFRNFGKNSWKRITIYERGMFQSQNPKLSISEKKFCKEFFGFSTVEILISGFFYVLSLITN